MTGPRAGDGWAAHIESLAQLDPGTSLRVELEHASHPGDAGFTRSSGLQVGQVEDWRMLLPDGRSAHVQWFPASGGGYWALHIDQVSPAVDPVEHVRVDAPEEMVKFCTVLGGLLGSAVGKTVNAGLVGAALGGALGVTLVANPNPDPKGGAEGD